MRALSSLAPLLSLLSFAVLVGYALDSFSQAINTPPAIAAKSYLLVDYHSQQPLAGKNADERVEPASLTKLMTAYLTFSALKQKQIQATQTVPVSERAWKAEG